jgi:hypothetical protein
MPNRRARGLVSRRKNNSAGGEDKGYFALEAGGRRFESCHGNYARVAQWIERLMFLCRLFPGCLICGAGTLARETVAVAQRIVRRAPRQEERIYDRNPNSIRNASRQRVALQFLLLGSHSKRIRGE